MLLLTTSFGSEPSLSLPILIVRRARSGIDPLAHDAFQTEPAHRLKNLSGWRLQEWREADRILGRGKQALQLLAPLGKRKTHEQLAILIQQIEAVKINRKRLQKSVLKELK